MDLDSKRIRCGPRNAFLVANVSIPPGTGSDTDMEPRSRPNPSMMYGVGMRYQQGCTINRQGPQGFWVLIAGRPARMRLVLSALKRVGGYGHQIKAPGFPVHRQTLWMRSANRCSLCPVLRSF